jgi:hypothetical protein
MPTTRMKTEFGLYILQSGRAAMSFVNSPQWFGASKAEPIVDMFLEDSGVDVTELGALDGRS